MTPLIIKEIQERLKAIKWVIDSVPAKNKVLKMIAEDMTAIETIIGSEEKGFLRAEDYIDFKTQVIRVPLPTGISLSYRTTAVMTLHVDFYESSIKNMFKNYDEFQKAMRTRLIGQMKWNAALIKVD